MDQARKKRANEHAKKQKELKEAATPAARAVGLRLDAAALAAIHAAGCVFGE